MSKGNKRTRQRRAAANAEAKQSNGTLQNANHSVAQNIVPQIQTQYEPSAPQNSAPASSRAQYSTHLNELGNVSIMNFC